MTWGACCKFFINTYKLLKIYKLSINQSITFLSFSLSEKDKTLQTEMSYGDGDSDDELFEKLEAELDQDGTFDYYKSQKIQELHSEIQRRNNLTNNLVFPESERQLLDRVSHSTSKYLVVFVNETFQSSIYLTHALKETIENSDGSYTVYIINAEKSPFLSTKLRIKTLPTIVAFVNGKRMGIKVGLDGFLNDRLDVSTVSPEKLASLCRQFFQGGRHRNEEDEDNDNDKDNDKD